jgi:hypothetical protein
MSQELADEMALIFSCAHASAFQVRLGGAKGVLMVKKTLTGK